MRSKVVVHDRAIIAVNAAIDNVSWLKVPNRGQVQISANLNDSAKFPASSVWRPSHPAAKIMTAE